MSRIYSDPKRENDLYALPDVEIWQERVTVVHCPHCGDYELPHDAAHATEEIYCPSCERTVDTAVVEDTNRSAWWYWYCLPGCLPDSGVYGPYETRAEAVEDIRSQCDMDNDDDNTEEEV